MTLSKATSSAKPSSDVQCTARPVRLAYWVSHPIQYQAPLLRRIAQEPGIDLTGLFGSDFSVRGYRDRGFGVDVKWDIPLLDGYKSEFLPVLRDKRKNSLFSPISRGIAGRLRGRRGEPAFDVLWVHGYATLNQLQGVLAAKFAGIPVLIRSDSSLRDRPRGAFKLLAKRAFFDVLRRLVDGVLISGTWNEDYWRHYMGPDFPLFLMPYAVDNLWFQEQSQNARSRRAELQAELGLDADRPVILFASKFQARKHCDDLLEAYKRLSPAPGEDPHPYLVIIGDGEERAALERQAAATGFSSIRFCGLRNQSELPRFFDLCSVFVLPSRHELWGLIVNEAMNASRPVIVSDDVGCAVDLVTDGVQGFVYPVRNIEALTDSLRRVIESPVTIARMGQSAQERIDAWDFEANVKGLRDAIARVYRPVPISEPCLASLEEGRHLISSKPFSSTRPPKGRPVRT